MSITARVKFLTELLLLTFLANAMDSYMPAIPLSGQGSQHPPPQSYGPT